jgi:peptidoglycan lytic transglycosylase G
MKRRQSVRRRLAGIGIAIVFVVLLGLYVTYRINLGAPSTSKAAVIVEIATGERVPQIADMLLSKGLIKDRNAFITYVTFHGLRTRIAAGTYSIAKDLTTPELADILVQGKTLSDRIVVPEGYKISQIEKLAASHGISTASFQAALAQTYSYSFLSTKPADVSLEGYLFPDSYAVDPTTTASTLVKNMLEDFGTKVGPEYSQAFASEGLTLHEGLTIASIVESEVSDPNVRPIVAQVFLSRLKLGMPLGSDVTAEYASSLLGVPFSTAVNSPYNTLIHPGLPPGPICSPGLDSLDAVAHPAQTNYLYFLTGRDGKTYFATTYAEHQQNIAKYLN